MNFLENTHFRENTYGTSLKISVTEILVIFVQKNFGPRIPLGVHRLCLFSVKPALESSMVGKNWNVFVKLMLVLGNIAYIVQTFSVSCVKIQRGAVEHAPFCRHRMYLYIDHDACILHQTEKSKGIAPIRQHARSQVLRASTYMGVGSRGGGRGPLLDFHTWYKFSK